MFEAMLETNMVEVQRGEVVIKDMEAATMEQLLQFIYTGTVNNMGIAMELVYAADKYQIKELVSKPSKSYHTQN